MLKIHHLVLSRSDRIVWLAEELGLKYELVRHDRNPQTMRAPESLWKVSPMGKAPVIEDEGKLILESGAITEYLVERYDNGKLRPAKDSDAYFAYLHWMHAAESTLMLPVLLDLLGSMTQSGSPGMTAFIEGDYKATLGYLDKTLKASEFVAGSAFSAADVMVVYTLKLANGTAIPQMKSIAPMAAYPAVTGYLKRVETRPAFQKAIKLCQ